MRLTIKIRTTHLYILFITITACQGVPVKNQSSVFGKPTVVQEPKRVLEEGIGLSFKMSTDDAKKLGFRDSSNKGVKHVGEWTKSKSAGIEGFWNWRNEINFTPITGQVRAFSGQHFYKKNSLSSELECLEDFRLISNKLKDKYPSLRKIRGRMNNNLNVPRKNYNDQLCEGEKRGGSWGSQGMGRCIYLTCAQQVWTDDTVIGSLLIIYYADGDLYETFSKEKEIFLKENRDTRLRKRGLSPEDL